MNPVQLKLYLPTLNISESQEHVLCDFAILPHNGACFRQAILPTRQHFAHHRSTPHLRRRRLHSPHQLRYLELCIPHLVVQSERVSVVHLLHQYILDFLHFSNTTLYTSRLLTNLMASFGSAIVRVSSSFHSGFRFFFITRVFNFCFNFFQTPTTLLLSFQILNQQQLMPNLSSIEQ